MASTVRRLVHLSCLRAVHRARALCLVRPTPPPPPPPCSTVSPARSLASRLCLCVCVRRLARSPALAPNGIMAHCLARASSSWRSRERGDMERWAGGRGTDAHGREDHRSALMQVALHATQAHTALQQRRHQHHQHRLLRGGGRGGAAQRARRHRSASQSPSSSRRSSGSSSRCSRAAARRPLLVLTLLLLTSARGALQAASCASTKTSSSIAGARLQCCSMHQVRCHCSCIRLYDCTLTMLVHPNYPTTDTLLVGLSDLLAITRFVRLW